MASGASVPHTLPVQIGTRQYLVDAEKVQRRTIPSQRQAVTQNPAGLDAVNIEGAWTKVIPSFHHGAGQTVYDGAFSDAYRVGYLAGIWSAEPGIACMSPYVSHSLSLGTADGTNCNALATFSFLYGRVGTALTRWDGFDLTSQTTITGITSPRWLAEFNGVVYVTDGSTIFSISGTAASSFSTQDADLIGVCNGRFLAGHDENIYEISSAGAATLIWTNPEAGDWKQLVGAPGAVYGVYETDTFRSTIYVWDDLDADGTFLAPHVGCTVPLGEQVRQVICVSGNVLALGTNLGVRLALINSDASLTLGPLLTGGAYNYQGYLLSTFAGVAGLTCVGSSLYAACQGGVVRLNLDNFVDELVPAWEQVVGNTYGPMAIAPTGGSVYVIMTSSGVIRVPHVNRPDINPSGLSQAGGINTGLITFGISEPKQILEASVDHDPLPANTQVTVAVYSRGGTQLGTTTNAVDGTSVTTLTLAPTVAPQRAYTINVLLETTSATATPVIRGGIRTRAIPVLPRQEEVVFPIDLRSSVKGRDGSAVTQSSLTEHDYLNGLIEAGIPVQITEGTKSYYALVDQLVYPGEEGSGQKWGDDDGWYEATVLVRLITVGID